MPVMEGVGDEVLVVVGVFVLLCVILLAWVSTHTRDIPFVSVIVVELSQRRQRSSNNNNNGSGDSQAEEQTGADRQLAESTPSETGGAGETVGTNNNADTANAEDSAAATIAASKSSVLEGAVSHPVPNSSSTKFTDSKPPVPSPVSESNPQDSIPEQAEAEGPGSGPVQAEAEEIMTIPPFRPSQLKSGEEVRQRRVAYFSGGGGSGQENSGTQKDADGQKDTDKQKDASQCTAAATTTTTGKLDSAEITASCQAPSHSAAPSVSLSDGQSSSCAHSGPVGASSFVSQSSETPSSCCDRPPHTDATDLRASQSERSSPKGATGGSPSKVTGESPSGVPESEAGASASEGGSERVQNDEAEAADTAGQQIRVRLKYLNDTQRLVYADPHETVGNFRRLHFSSELGDNKVVRFIFNGQDLRNDLTTLQAYNINDNSVVHCLITQNQRGNDAHSGSARGRGSQDDEVQMGAMLFPVFGVILGLVWYLRFTYKQYFNAMSTVSLAGISFIYLLAFVSSVRHRRQPHHVHLE